MAVDVTRFHSYNITDTCAVWNVLSSATLCEAAHGARCHFACTAYVIYECLTKPRKTSTDADTVLRERLLRQRELGRFQEFHLTLDELEDVALLERRRKLAKGELSSIAFARKNRQAVLTDDQKARRLANEVCDDGMVQTTPQLLGWLFFTRSLIDSDLKEVMKEHEEVNRPLKKHFEEMYRQGLERRAMVTSLG
jgi:predicted nucleic acid-binding protein